jgi:hypothetical protein
MAIDATKRIRAFSSKRNIKDFGKRLDKQGYRGTSATRVQLQGGYQLLSERRRELQLRHMQSLPLRLACGDHTFFIAKVFALGGTILLTILLFSYCINRFNACIQSPLVDGSRPFEAVFSAMNERGQVVFCNMTCTKSLREVEDALRLVCCSHPTPVRPNALSLTVGFWPALNDCFRYVWFISCSCRSGLGRLGHCCGLAISAARTGNFSRVCSQHSQSPDAR